MHEFLEFTIIGIVLGSAYAVAASGLVVTYATSGIFNIAHGAMGMFMAFVYWQLSVGWHLNPALAFVLTVFVLAPLLGAAVERGVIQWMDPNNVATTLAVTVGLTLLFFGLVNNYLWKPTARFVPQFFGFSGFTFLGVHIDWEEVITVGAAVAIAVGLRLFLYRTPTSVDPAMALDRQRLASELIHHVQQLQVVPVRSLIELKIDRPHVIRPLRPKPLGWHGRGPEALAFAPLSRDAQALLAPHPAGPLDVQRPAVVEQQPMRAPIPPTRPLPRDPPAAPSATPHHRRPPRAHDAESSDADRPAGTPDAPTSPAGPATRARARRRRAGLESFPSPAP